ncbi:overexpressed in colon carcinoma 1 protein isoform X3 [Phyllobates terribilis]|uniref:overexpressed in colon carcinoma 1 protein isoform X3 n=1 Tax=Phyllobates terribilis TaxID=111132 RepID=UPI003CCA8594
MGCSHSSSAGGCKGPSKDMSGDVTSQDDKHRNYGGVYVGLPADTTTAYRDPKGAEEMNQNSINLRPPASRKHGAQCLDPLCRRMSANITLD